MRAEINWCQVTSPRWSQGQPNGITTKPGTSSQGKALDYQRQGCPRGHQEVNTQPSISQCFWDAGQEKAVFEATSGMRISRQCWRLTLESGYHLNAD